MIEYILISISSLSAICLALPIGLTLKPIIIASDADAKSTSLSVIAPTPLWIIFTCISSVESFRKESVNASTEPSTSPLRITFNSLKSPNAILRPISSKVIWRWVLTDCSRCNWVRLEAIPFASLSSPNTLNLSPACGAPSRPKIDIGVAGPASFTLCPRSSCIAFTFPLHWPANK